MNGKRDEQIRSRAYGIWEREGRPQGRQEHHWHQAVREVDEGAGDQAPTPTSPGTPTASAPVGKTVARAKRPSALKAPAQPKAPAKKPKAPGKPKA